MSVKTSCHPTPQKERIEVIDILRGLALFGILLANMAHFSSPIIYLQLTDIELWDTPWDKWAQGWLTIFVEGKFYTLFSFLFGWGFVLFMERAKEKGKHPHLLYSRRLVGLFCFGFLHAYLLWYGDILMLYAVSGFILLLFYKCKPRTLLIWAVIFVLLSILPILLIVVSAQGLGETGQMQWIHANQALIEEMKERAIIAYQAYGSGTLAEIVKQRVQDVQFMLSYAPFTIPMILPMFLLGAYVGKKRLIQEARKYEPLIKQIWLISLVLGLGLSILKYVSLQQLNVYFPSRYDLFVQVSMAIGDPALSICYITSVLLLMQSEKWRLRLSRLAPAGRMAFSHYIGQSTICTLIFYNVGLGLYGQVGPALGLLLSSIIFLFQVWFSKLWLTSYSYGPLEWIWRRFTYGSLLRLR